MLFSLRTTLYFFKRIAKIRRDKFLFQTNFKKFRNHFYNAYPENVSEESNFYPTSEKLIQIVFNVKKITTNQILTNYRKQLLKRERAKAQRNPP